ncbi:twin-arginine translocase TatA/TatE family subunit [Aquihabitans sp. G128]|uniref:twin-arginine translocase TatA/TatE family subunit n=1 Tax=Aquihabitans sp. G128 TaxID=2849779 RepID=UPI001C2418D4|nr:twin-arginine translocase TatA/TatE family subunit [Aquihabitans sp. G128]QXC59414.1 twin-arginine translocase TatA/TatE family subunit [Aquihabitans sp. G128]
MAGLGAPELLIVLVLVLVVFGGAKLPKLARSLGDAQREFKKGSEEGAETTVHKAVVTDAAGTPKATVTETVVVETSPKD